MTYHVIENYGWYRVCKWQNDENLNDYKYELWYGGALWATVRNRDYPTITEWVNTRENDD